MADPRNGFVPVGLPRSKANYASAGAARIVYEDTLPSGYRILVDTEAFTKQSQQLFASVSEAQTAWRDTQLDFERAA